MRLALDDQHDPPRHAEAARDHGRRERVGRGHHGADTNALAQGRPSIAAWATTRDGNRRRDDHADRQEPDRLDVRTEVAQRGEERGAVEERRKDADQDEVRVEPTSGMGTKPTSRPPTTSRIG